LIHDSSPQVITVDETDLMVKSIQENPQSGYPVTWPIFEPGTSLNEA